MCVLLFYWQDVCIYCSSHPAVQQSVSTSLGSFVYQKQHTWLRFWAGSEMLHSHKHLLPQRLSVCTLQDARDRAVSSKRNLWWFMTYEMLFYNCSSKCFAGREKHHGKYKYALPLLIRWMLLFKVMVVMLFIPVLYMLLEGFFSFHLCFQSLFDVLLAVIQYYMPFIIECLFLYFISSSTMFKTNFLLGTIKVIWLDWFIWVLFQLTLDYKVRGKHFTLIVELIVFNWCIVGHSS